MPADLTIKAAVAMEWFGVAYAAGDPIDTSDYTAHGMLDLLTHAPVYVVSGIAQPTVPLANGQLYGVDGSGNMVAVNPTGNGELAAAENVTGTTQSISSSSTAGGGNFTTVTNCQIVVPASTRPVYLEGSATVSFPSAPSASLGAVILELVEVSNGVDTPLTWSTNVPVTGQGQFNSVTVNFLPRRLGTTARNRTFNLVIGNFQAALTVLNSVGQSSRIIAEAR